MADKLERATGVDVCLIPPRVATVTTTTPIINTMPHVVDRPLTLLCDQLGTDLSVPQYDASLAFDSL